MIFIPFPLDDPALWLGALLFAGHSAPVVDSRKGGNDGLAGAGSGRFWRDFWSSDTVLPQWRSWIWFASSDKLRMLGGTFSLSA